MYIAKKFDRLVGLDGFSEKMLQNHFSLYEGYVNNVNKLLELLNSEESGTLEYAELRRRFGWEWNGMRLHELYFENFSKDGKGMDPNSKLGEKIQKDFGSFENWKKEFVSIGLMRGIGWVVLYYDRIAKKLLNIWINEHDAGHLSGCSPILVMDVFEHAYITDYGTKRLEYIKSFMKAVDGKIINSRLLSSVEK